MYLLFFFEVEHKDNIGGDKKVLHSCLVWGSHFDLKFFGVGLAASEAQATPGDVLTSDNVVPISKAPDAVLEAHFRTHMFTPIFRARPRSRSRNCHQCLFRHACPTPHPLAAPP